MDSAIRETARSRHHSEPSVRPADGRTIRARWKPLASSVDELMLTIASRAPNADSTHIAVLACLHLADKLRTLERDSASSEGARGPQVAASSPACWSS